MWNATCGQSITVPLCSSFLLSSSHFPLLPQAEVWNLLWAWSLHRLQGHPYSNTCSPAFSSFFSHLGVPGLFFTLFLPTPLLVQHFVLSFHRGTNRVIDRLSCGFCGIIVEPSGTTWNQLCLAQGSSWSSLTEVPEVPGANTLPNTPNPPFNFFQ